MLAMVMPVRELAIEAAKASSDSVACDSRSRKRAVRLFAELLCCWLDDSSAVDSSGAEV